jgi:hypothetical protein
VEGAFVVLRRDCHGSNIVDARWGCREEERTEVGKSKLALFAIGMCHKVV